VTQDKHRRSLYGHAFDQCSHAWSLWRKGGRRGIDSHWSISFSCSVIGGMLAAWLRGRCRRAAGVLELTVIAARSTTFEDVLNRRDNPIVILSHTIENCPHTGPKDAGLR